MKQKIHTKALKNVLFSRMTCQVDDAFLVQVKRIYPAAYFAGVIEWNGLHVEDAWIKWHWYMTGRNEQVQIPLDAITTNIVLVDDDGIELGEEQTRIILERRVRRAREWERSYRQQFPRNRALAERRKVVASQAPDMASEFQPLDRLQHDDGTTTWALNALGDLSILRQEQQFGAVAKLFRDKFGFHNIMAVAKSASNPNDFIIDTNDRTAWRTAYLEHEFVHYDPRISTGAGQPFTWSQCNAAAEDSEFWYVARKHDIKSGWSMSSKDNRFTVVLCSDGEPIPAIELSKIEPNLQVLAQLVLTLMGARLKDFVKEKEEQERTIPAGTLDHIDIDILKLICKGERVKVIADRLKLSESTVNNRLKAARRKLFATSLAHLVVVATAKGLLTTEAC